MHLVIYGTIPATGTAALLARVTGWDGEPVTAAAVASVAWSVFRAAPQESKHRPVEGHQNLALDPAAVIGPEDADGMNFRHVPPVDAGAPFSESESRYLVRYTIRPAAGEPLVVPFVLTTVG